MMCGRQIAIVQRLERNHKRKIKAYAKDMQIFHKWI